MSNCFGERFKIITFGESHGNAVGVVMDGIRPGLDFNIETIQTELNRRRPGQSRFVSARAESDRVEVLSGVFEGKTLGTPICLVVRNQNQNSGAYEELKDLFSPGHAGYTTWMKYGIRDHRGGGRSSGRETIGRVAAGAFAKQELAKEGIRVIGYTSEMNGIKARKIDFAEIEKNPFRCPDRSAAKRMEKKIVSIKSEGDSIGGMVAIVALNIPPGLGDPVFKKLDAEMASALMSIGGVKAVEIGDGMKVARLKGSENNDQMDRSGFKTNHSGGIVGGISTGQEIWMRIAVKPTPSIEKLQETIDVSGNERQISIRGRHDPCICPRIVPVAEAMVALVLYDALLRQSELQAKPDDIGQLRREIDRLDYGMVELLSHRREVSFKIGQYKKEKGMEITDPSREKELLGQRIQWANERGMDEELVKEIFSRILVDSKRVQRS